MLCRSTINTVDRPCAHAWHLRRVGAVCYGCCIAQHVMTENQCSIFFFSSHLLSWPFSFSLPPIHSRNSDPTSKWSRSWYVRCVAGLSRPIKGGLVGRSTHLRRPRLPRKGWERSRRQDWRQRRRGERALASVYLARGLWLGCGRAVMWLTITRRLPGTLFVGEGIAVTSLRAVVCGVLFIVSVFVSDWRVCGWTQPFVLIGVD